MLTWFWNRKWFAQKMIQEMLGETQILKQQPDDCGLTHIVWEIESAFFAACEARFFGHRTQVFLSGSPLGYFYYLLSVVFLMRQASWITLIAPITVHFKSGKISAALWKQWNKIRIHASKFLFQFFTSLTYSHLSPFHLWLHFNALDGSPSAGLN